MNISKRNKKLGLVALSGLILVPVASAVSVVNAEVPQNVFAYDGFMVAPAWEDISFSAQHAVGLSTDKKVYAWGRNNYGQSAKPPTSGLFSTRPHLVEGLENVKLVIAGEHHSVAVTEDDEVFTWGRGSNGRLGHGDTANQMTPKLVEGLNFDSPIKSVKAGNMSTLILLENGDVYYTGNANIGGSVSITEFTKIDALSDIAEIEVENTGYMARNSQGEVYSWGVAFADNGLGLGAGVTNVTTPTKIEGIPSAKEIRVGAILAEDDTLWVWGSNNVGQLGQGNTNNITDIVQVPLTGILTFHRNNTNGYAKTADGHYVWGSGTTGKLGNNSSFDRHAPTLTARHVDVEKYVGDFVGAYIDTAGDLFTFGRHNATNEGIHGRGDTTLTATSPELVSSVFEPTTAVFEFDPISEDAVHIQWDRFMMENAETYTITRNGTHIHSGSGLNVVDNGLYEGIVYTYDITITDGKRTFTHQIEYTHGEALGRPTNSEAEEEGSDEEGEGVLSRLWSFISTDVDYATPLVPQVTVVEGNNFEITLKDANWEFTGDFATDLGTIAIESDPSGNVVISSEEGLESSGVTETLELEHEGANFLDITVVPKPQLNFNFGN